MDPLRPSPSSSYSAQSVPKPAEEERPTGAEGEPCRDGGDPVAVCQRRALTLGKGKGVVGSKSKKVDKDAASSSSSASSSSATTTTFHPSRKLSLQKGVRLRSRRGRVLSVSCSGQDDEILDDLALPLGMSFAAIVAQVLNGKNVTGDRVSLDRLSMMCTVAVKESITNIYGDKFGIFIRNFEKSFGSTLKTLHKISVASTNDQENTACNSYTCNVFETAPVSGIADAIKDIEDDQENASFNAVNNQLVLHGPIHQQLSQTSRSRSGPEFSQSLLNTFERSVLEHTRTNDLKAFEIGLVMKKLQLKQDQLALSSETNFLEKIKIRMGISKASFKEEKLRNQMQEMKHAELLKRCIDILVTGLFIMCGLLVYAAFVFSYQRITDVTSACSSTPKESKSWWIPKQVTLFSSGWLMLRCHVVALTRMSFGILMILSIAYLVFQRSAISNPAMPVTFIVLLLGILCGSAGKLCVDTLGGHGFHWLIYWEVLCMLHFLANVFPDFFYHILYGPVTVSQGAKVVRLPYWVRRYAFYSILLLVLPTLTALLPFASVHDWKDHFSEKLSLWRSGDEYEG